MRAGLRPSCPRAGDADSLKAGARMSIAERLDGWGRGVRAPLLAALLALIAGLPGVLAVPPIDRDESRFAEASAQMLETGDFTTIRFQDQPRFKKPVGIYWLQAVAVAVASHVEDRRIWPYRLPSLAGAMRARGIPVLTVEAELGSSAPAGMMTRVEAFLESLP